MGLTLEINQGASRDFPLQVSNPDGTPATQFLNTDTLLTNVWQGTNETALDNPTTTWLNSNAPAGQILISFQNTDSAALAIGQYYIQSYATRTGTPARTAALLPKGSSLTVLAAAGAVFTARPTYITIQSVRNIAPWIDDLIVPDNDTGFDNQLADARSWLDEIILRNYRGGNVSLLGYHGFALDAWYTGGGRRTSLTNRWLFAALKSNQLLVTQRIIDIQAYYALSRICESMITKAGQYVSLAARFRFEAEMLLSSTTAEIDVNGDGFGEVPVNLSGTNTLWA